MRWRLCGRVAPVPCTPWKTDRNNWAWVTRLEPMALNVDFRPAVNNFPREDRTNIKTRFLVIKNWCSLIYFHGWLVSLPSSLR